MGSCFVFQCGVFVLALFAVVGQGSMLRSATRHRLAYGHILSANGNSTREDYELLTQFLSKRIKNIKICKMSISKQMLYHTMDQKSPSTISRTGRYVCYDEYIKMGEHFSLTLSCPSHMMHHFTITTDLLNQLHLNQHIYAPIEQADMLCCSPYLSSAAFLPNLSSFRSKQSFLTHCSRHVHYSARINLATYNVWNVNELGNQTASERTRQLGKYLLSSEVDIVGLQEMRVVSKDSPFSQVKILSEVLSNYQFVYQPAMLYSSSSSIEQEGLAIFSRFPIISSDYILLPRNLSDENDDHQRICLHAVIDTPGGHVHVFVSHLTLSEEQQNRSVREIWRYMSLSSGVAVLMGDLNAEPSSEPIKFLTGELTIAGEMTHNMVDVWEVAGDDDGLTFSALEQEPQKRIDYIFLRADTDLNVCVNYVKLLRKNSTFLSDHFGVIAGLQFFNP